MKQLLFFLFISASIFAQDFSSIKMKTDSYSGLLTAEKLANNIKRDFSTDENKVKAIFCWMTKNIRYDLEEFYNPSRNASYGFRYRTQEELEQKLQAIKDTTVTETLSSRKAVCEGYAQTFSKICDLLDIENEVVKGYVRQRASSINNPSAQPNHAWNAVKINKKWIFIDATWAAGHEINGRWLRKFNPYYYNISREHHFKTHLPEKSVWVLRIGRIEKEDFYNQPIYKPTFLTSNIELVSPKTGIINRKNGKIEFKLKNITPTQTIHVGFVGMRFAQNPDIVTENGITTVSIVPPSGTQQTFLIIDKKVMLEFLVK